MPYNYILKKTESKFKIEIIYMKKETEADEDELRKKN